MTIKAVIFVHGIGTTIGSHDSGKNIKAIMSSGLMEDSIYDRKVFEYIPDSNNVVIRNTWTLSGIRCN